MQFASEEGLGLFLFAVFLHDHPPSNAGVLVDGVGIVIRVLRDLIHFLPFRVAVGFNHCQGEPVCEVDFASPWEQERPANLRDSGVASPYDTGVGHDRECDGDCLIPDIVHQTDAFFHLSMLRHVQYALVHPANDIHLCKVLAGHSHNVEIAGQKLRRHAVSIVHQDIKGHNMESHIPSQMYGSILLQNRAFIFS